MIGNFQHLRTQMSLAMIFTAFTSLLIFVTGMAVFYIRLQRNWVSSLTPDNQDKLRTLIEDGDIDPDTLTTLVGAFSQSWSGNSADLEFLAFVVLVIIAIISASLIGIRFSRRLSRPIETLTAAANQVAAGSLEVRVDDLAPGSGETRELFASFNHMTEALQDAERESAYSAAAIAHELRTPLTVLRGQLQGIGDGVYEPTPELIKGLVGQIDTLSTIADDLGTLSRIGEDKTHKVYEEVNLAAEVESVVKTVETDLIAEGMEIRLLLATAQIKGDAARIRQALNALIQNARLYASSGKLLQIETFADKSMAEIKVTDRGPGIPEQDRPKVFDRWWRGEPSRGRADGGSGLGLSVVKAIIRDHGGTIRAKEGSDGRGTVFHILLPVLTSSNPASRAVSA